MKKLFLILSVLPALAHALDIPWVEMDVELAYSDKDTSCSGFGGRLYFSAEVEYQTTRVAQMQNYPKTSSYIPIFVGQRLSVTEISTLQYFRDLRGEYWLKNLEISESTFRWSIQASTAKHGLCRLPALKVLNTGGAKFEFNTEGLEEQIYISESQVVTFSGIRKDGHPFKGMIRLIQRDLHSNAY